MLHEVHSSALTDAVFMDYFGNALHFIRLLQVKAGNQYTRLHCIIAKEEHSCESKELPRKGGSPQSVWWLVEQSKGRESGTSRRGTLAAIRETNCTRAELCFCAR